jgi:hypothetical protein
MTNSEHIKANYSVIFNIVPSKLNTVDGGATWMFGLIRQWAPFCTLHLASREGLRAAAATRRGEAWANDADAAAAATIAELNDHPSA